MAWPGVHMPAADQCRDYALLGEVPRLEVIDSRSAFAEFHSPPESLILELSMAKPFHGLWSS